MSAIEALAITTVIVMLAGVVLQQRQRVRIGKERVRLARQEKDAAIKLMDNIGESLTRKIDLNETLEVIADYVVSATAAQSSAVFLLDEAEQILQARVVSGDFPPLLEDKDIPASPEHYHPEDLKRRQIKVGEGILGRVATYERPLLIEDAEAHPLVPRAVVERFSVRSLLLCPMRVRGRCLGVIAIANKQGAARFDTDVEMLLLSLADQAAVAVDLVQLYDGLDEQRRLEQELRVAQDFQDMLLPTSLPELENYEFGAISRAALVVGGDFYDFFLVDKEHLGVVIGDVSGKGIPGALIMAMVRSVLRAEARDSFSPKEVLRRVNEAVRADTKESVFVTLTYGILDFSTDRFRFSRAGHEPTLIRKGSEEGEVLVLQPEGIAAGLMPPEMFDRIEEVEVQLSPGDLVLLYTDGVIEAGAEASPAQYGRERVIQLLAEAEGAGAEAPALLAALEADIQSFTKGAAQQDDITIVAFRMKQPGAEAPEEEPARIVSRASVKETA